MDPATFDLLVSPTGRTALAAAAALDPSEAKYPAHFDRLRRHFPAELARAALDTVLLRRRARVKFARADEMFFTREALEMASGEAVARYRADRFAAFGSVLDLCCGIGGDAIGLALAGRSVTGIDRDPLLVRMAGANLSAYGVGGTLVCGDVAAALLPDAGAAFADPSRRVGGRRKLSVHDYDPPLPVILARFPAGFPLGVKLAPGVPREELAAFDADPEFTSLDGELKECVLWFGPLRTGLVRASVLPGPHVLAGVPEPAGESGPVAGYLYDPDPAVTRSGLVSLLADRIGARLVDPGIAFLTSDRLVPTPFAAAYRVEEVLPFSPKWVGAWLKARGVGRVTIVKRGSAADADELTARWKLKGDGHRQVILTRSEGQPVAVIGERVPGQ